MNKTQRSTLREVADLIETGKVRLTGDYSLAQRDTAKHVAYNAVGVLARTAGVTVDDLTNTGYAAAENAIKQKLGLDQLDIDAVFNIEKYVAPEQRRQATAKAIRVLSRGKSITSSFDFLSENGFGNQLSSGN
jgi:broad specificity phosphatase PhoE